MEILAAVVATVLIIGLILSILITVSSVSLLQSQQKELAALKALTNKYMHDQQQIGSLFVQFLMSLNTLTAAVDDLAMSRDMDGFNFPEMERGEPWENNDIPGMFGPNSTTPPMNTGGSQLSEDEIEKLYRLLTSEFDEDEQEDNGNT